MWFAKWRGTGSVWRLAKKTRKHMTFQSNTPADSLVSFWQSPSMAKHCTCCPHRQPVLHKDASVENAWKLLKHVLGKGSKKHVSPPTRLIYEYVNIYIHIYYILNIYIYTSHLISNVCINLLDIHEMSSTDIYSTASMVVVSPPFSKTRNILILLMIEWKQSAKCVGP